MSLMSDGGCRLFGAIQDLATAGIVWELSMELVTMDWLQSKDLCKQYYRVKENWEVREQASGDGFERTLRQTYKKYPSRVTK